MNPQITLLIDQYLLGELSEADHMAFETRLATSEKLQQEVYLQQQVYDAAARASMRTLVKKVSRHYHLKRKLVLTGIVLAGTALLAAATMLAIYFSTKNHDADNASFLALTQKLETESPIGNLPATYFQWDGADSVLLTPQSVLLSVPAHAFLLHGKPYDAPAVIQWQEALDAATIVKSGLSTQSGDRLLETQGMFGIQAFTPSGEKLEINPKVGIYVQVPVDEYKKDMQLFEGKANAQGIIDWQNPKKLAKIPVSVPMSQLDFYPKGYEDTLDYLRQRKDKKFRDSLYLSFASTSKKSTNSEMEDSLPGNKLGKALFESKCATCHAIYRDGTGPHLFQVRQKWANSSAQEGSIYKWVQNWQQAAHQDPYAYKIAASSPNVMNNFPELSYQEMDQIFDYIDGINYDSYAAGCGISPAKVLGFWNSKFDHTNLATREFESRMRVIHSECSEDLLDLYVQNLALPISTTDAKIAAMGYREFESFAAEQLGAVNPRNAHSANLQRFYARTVNQLQHLSQQLQAAQIRKAQKWDAGTQQSRTAENKRTQQRKVQSFQEEFALNYPEKIQRYAQRAQKQLDKTVGFTITGNAAIYNLDRFVFNATVNRKSGSFTDPQTGKTTTITYNDFSLEVDGAEKYKQLYVYLFPSGIQSFERISGSAGKFSYALNNAMQYDLAIVGISEKGYAYYQQKALKGGSLGKISPNPVSETQLDASIRQLNAGRISKPMDVGSELRWLVREQQDYIAQKQRRDQEIFCGRIRNIIFPCCESRFLSTGKAVFGSEELPQFQ